MASSSGAPRGASSTGATCHSANSASGSPGATVATAASISAAAGSGVAAVIACSPAGSGWSNTRRAAVATTRAGCASQRAGVRVVGGTGGGAIGNGVAEVNGSPPAARVVGSEASPGAPASVSGHGAAGAGRSRPRRRIS